VFGLRRHPILKDHRVHQGVDIAAPEGTEVRSLRKGKVVFSGWREGYGNTVIIDHGDGMMSKYAHNKQNLVKAGDEVDQATLIARVGSTGRSTGPHLHFEVINDGERVDPLQVLPSG
jgi:murein DD-endopeptidase MepM/ murein hydrolase activator NlpD